MNDFAAGLSNGVVVNRNFERNRRPDRGGHSSSGYREHQQRLQTTRYRSEAGEIGAGSDAAEAPGSLTDAERADRFVLVQGSRGPRTPGGKFQPDRGNKNPVSVWEMIMDVAILALLCLALLQMSFGTVKWLVG